VTVPGSDLFPGSDLDTGGRTLADLRTEALGNDFNSAVYSTRTTQYINEALRRVDRQVRLPVREGTQTFVTSAGTNTLTLPLFRARVISLRNTDDRDPLLNVDIGEIDQAADATGKPTAYAFYGGQVTLYPTPDAAYNLELRYRATGAEFTDDTQTTGMVGFPNDYAGLLVTYARWRLYVAEDDPAMAQVWEQDFRTQLGELKADIQRQSSDMPRQVPSMWNTGPVAELRWRE
jgi:hypothetical protein